MDTALISYEDGKVQYQVRILGVISAYGRTRYRVEPIAGKGEFTADSSRVTLDRKPSKWDGKK